LDQELDQLIRQNFPIAFHTLETVVEPVERRRFVKSDSADLPQMFPCRGQTTVL
jgi:hypothetical protein